LTDAHRRRDAKSLVHCVDNQVRNYGWETGADYSGDTRNCKRHRDLVPKADFSER
jgi:hypothetical protein